MANSAFILVGGLIGAAGVALSAASAHLGGGNVGTVASFALAHAPVFLSVGLLGRNRVMNTGSVVLLVGLLLFSADLLMRQFHGTRLFPMSAPLGGTAMIAGWLTLAASAFWTKKSG
ncbi:DUF423 domain-containing protein [Aquamicrobium zhengzhouense]|uniref:DUF423 domain-containing protein n=1 Tax=Aquamicrobium zhengzhouense TaxID=2781738 RepID=A0ABS0SHU3_9HYPH|nr:DUF423 domain-containing protein [Aquamicrobium zhengzhouense]MBI1622816.1 DUF423 domain-containing protein [Aquamicrobium zhengzhouense]